MARPAIRQMKRAVAAGGRPHAGAEAVVLAQQSALSLLARSIAFGHGRLAVIRLSMAVQAGAAIPPQHWAYCREIALPSADAGLRAMFLQAEQAAANPPVDPPTRPASTESH